MQRFLNYFKTAFIVSISMFIICGLLYPLSLTLLSNITFSDKANGSLIQYNGEIVGSEIVGQNFEDEKLFHSRPSSVNYNTYTKEDLLNGNYSGIASGSQNLASSNPLLLERIKEDVDKFLKENKDVSINEIPSDLITHSGSGLDPHISVLGAKVQISRVSENTGLSKEVLETLIDNNTDKKVLGIFGEDKVNVLKLNLELMKELNK